jgi:5-methylcytosine-specific restriction endonuclease McrA
MTKAWVKVDVFQAPVEVFKSQSAAIAALRENPEDCSRNLIEMDRMRAVVHIRSRVYARAKGRCEKCNATLTPMTAHMDEKVSRGEGGNISLENCWLLCANCHILDPKSEHGDRRPQWLK